jgi:hypothetical protein
VDESKNMFENSYNFRSVFTLTINIWLTIFLFRNGVFEEMIFSILIEDSPSNEGDSNSVLGPLKIFFVFFLRSQKAKIVLPFGREN